MTIEELLDCPADRWESLTDEQLLAIAESNGWLVITRPDLAAKKRETTQELMSLALEGEDQSTIKRTSTRTAKSSKGISDEKKRKIMEMAAKHGMDVEGVF